MFPIPARTRAGILTAAAAAAAALGVATPASAVVPTFERTDYATEHRATTVSIGDVTGDERPDVVTNSLLGSALAVYPGAGGGLLAPVNAFALDPVLPFTSGVSLGDVDGDGDLDAAILREYEVAFARNDGTGAFSVAQRIPTHRAFGYILLDDVTGDGRADLIGTYGHASSTQPEGGAVVFAAGDGDAPLVERWRETFAGTAAGVMHEDVDGDGHRDLVYAARIRVGDTWTYDAPDGLVIQPGDGTGSFGTRRFLDAGAQQTTNFPRYFDTTGDGVKDLVAGHGNSGRISIWRGLGGGEFADAVLPQSTSYGTDAILGDYDGDGRMDAAFPYGPNYRVDVFTDWVDNQAQGFVRLTVPQQNVYAVASGDLDGDGRTDLVVASHDDWDMTRALTVFRNTTTPPKACGDGLDNDGDGKRDIDDPGCENARDDDETDPAPPPPPPPPPAQCADGSDNDGDGKVDGADAGCTSTSDDDESDDPPPPPPPVEPLPWAGFFAPVNNQPMVNLATAGRAIPVKFSLGGDRGLDVFAEGYPRSQQVECSSTAEVDGIEETVSPGAGALTYDASADRYQYVWKTSDAWAGTCRQLVLKLRDGSFHRASFRFR